MTNSNDSAYPYEVEKYVDDYLTKINHSGLTKREYFAAMAMQGLIMRESIIMTNCSKKSVEMADALINELNKKEK